MNDKQHDLFCSSGGGRYFRVGGGTNQFARAPESAGPHLVAEGPPEANEGALVSDPECATGPLEIMKGPETPSDEKEQPKDPEPPGPPERMARSSKHVRGPL